MKSRFATEQIIRILQKQEDGMKVREIKPVALRPHQSWLMDFVHDMTENGRTLRVLNIVGYIPD